jgi:hypothetical protein
MNDEALFWNDIKQTRKQTYFKLRHEESEANSGTYKNMKQKKKILIKVICS